MIKGFEFEHDGRVYTCTVEARHGFPSDHWWWFSVSGDAQRYAPFRAAKDDTQQSVMRRVAEFYAARLHALAQPTERGSHWGKRNGTSAKAAAAKAAAAKKAAAARAKILQAERKKEEAAAARKAAAEKRAAAKGAKAPAAKKAAAKKPAAKKAAAKKSAAKKPAAKKPATKKPAKKK